ncbi:MAG: hypothetical protein ABSG53_30240 [Thermoguttaceae bacterium]|jgi:hypothetical protein
MQTITMGRVLTEATIENLEDQIPLENLDLVVDLGARKLIGNPAHGGEHMFEMY